MLYPSQVIAEERLGAVSMAEPLPAADCFLSAIRRMNGLFEEKPALLVLPAGKTTTLLYRNAVYLWRDIAEQVGVLAAWGGIRFFGTTEGRETAELMFRLEEKELTAQLHSLSGKPFDHLQSLGLQMEWPDQETAARMAELAGAVPVRGACCAVPSQAQPLLPHSSLTVPSEGSLFLYLAWEPVGRQEQLQAQTVAQKARLWREFLKHGQQPIEFDWLWDRYYTGEFLLLLEWELALRMVLEELGFQVARSEHTLQITDVNGLERRFDINRGGPAEKIFLKLLFPLDDK